VSFQKVVHSARIVNADVAGEQNVEHAGRDPREIYEAVFDDLEAQARRMLYFLGLPWNEACLRFRETHRPVHTASVNQCASRFIAIRKVDRGSMRLIWSRCSPRSARALAEGT
jgi:hypothetical protein